MKIRAKMNVCCPAVVVSIFGLGCAWSATTLQPVNYGKAGEFLILDYDQTTSGESLLDKNNTGDYNGNVGWVSPSEPLKITSSVTIDGNLTARTGAAGNITLEGGPSQVTDGLNLISDKDMMTIKAHAEGARDDFDDLIGMGNTSLASIPGGFTRPVDGLPGFNYFASAAAGGITVIERTDVDLSSETLTLNGTADDLFYILVSGKFSLSSSAVVAYTGGLISDNVFFYHYSNSEDLKLSSSTLTGNLFTKSSFVDISSQNGFAGTIVSGGGFKIQGDNFNYIAPGIPEPSVSMMALLSIPLLFRRRR